MQPDEDNLFATICLTNSPLVFFYVGGDRFGEHYLETDEDTRP